MIPDSIAALLIVAAIFGPGYAFIRVAERRDPRPARSALLELTELVSIGLSCSAATTLAGIVVAEETGWVDVEALGRDGTAYALANPTPVFLAFGVVLLASFILASLLSWWLHRTLPATLRHYSVWHELFRRQQDGRAPYATVELRDGRTIAGPVAVYTVEERPPDERDLVLIQPIVARSNARAEFVQIPDERVLLRASDFAAVSLTYFEQDATP